ncbi:IS21 family transposase [Sinorhizobium medicae]|uniref:IS21 family transposase n=1 Tax=Sinorhizobium medicae TaxID=110321 RepID=UPI0011A579B9|nr:IS21 family transposase [Sinorhizobium medicae]
MRRVREILRYRFEQGLGHKSIAVRVGAAPSTVRETLRRAAIAELSWPLGDDVSDAVLEAALYKAAGTKTGHRRSPEPDWAQVHRELKRKHMTLQILWDEYISRYPEGYRYSRFCDLYRGWAMKLPVTMRQDHAAGDKLFVDYAGDTVTVVVDRLSGKTRQAHLFVAVLGASSLSYAQARWSETLPDWIECHILALEYFGGAPALLVPDNAKVAIIKACHFDPQVNRTYCGMAAHYGSAVLPTRPRRPFGVREMFGFAVGNKFAKGLCHVPSAHRRFADWTIERIQREASAMGPDVALLCERILADRPHPEQGFRACLGIIRLNKSFGRDRVNAACGRALEIGARTYGSVRSILDNHLDRTAASNGAAPHEPIHHANIRGPRYYH